MPVKLVRYVVPPVRTFCVGSNWDGSLEYFFAIYFEGDVLIRKEPNNTIRVTASPNSFSDFDIGDKVRFTTKGAPFGDIYTHYTAGSCYDTIVGVAADKSEILIQLDALRYNAVPPPPSGQADIEAEFKLCYYGEFEKLFFQADVHGADRQYDIPPVNNSFTYEFKCNYPAGYYPCTFNGVIFTTDNTFPSALDKETRRGLVLPGITSILIEKDWDDFLSADFHYHSIVLSPPPSLFSLFIYPQSQSQAYYELFAGPSIRLRLGFQKVTSPQVLWAEDVLEAEAGWWNELPDGSAIPTADRPTSWNFTLGSLIASAPFLAITPQTLNINQLGGVSQLRFVRKSWDKRRIEDNFYDVPILGVTTNFNLPPTFIDPIQDADEEFYVYFLGTSSSQPFSLLIHEGKLSTPPPPPSPISTPWCYYLPPPLPACEYDFKSIPEVLAAAIPQPSYPVTTPEEFVKKYSVWKDPTPVRLLPLEPIYIVLSPRDASANPPVKPARIRQDLFVSGFFARSYESGYDTILPTRLPSPLNRPTPYAPYLNERSEVIAGKDSILIPYAPFAGENEIASGIVQDPHINVGQVHMYGVGEWNGIFFQELFSMAQPTLYNTGLAPLGFSFNMSPAGIYHEGDTLLFSLEKAGMTSDIPSFILFYIAIYERASGQVILHNWAVRQQDVFYIDPTAHAPNAISMLYNGPDNFKLTIEIQAPQPGRYNAVAGVRIYTFPGAIPDSRTLYHHENKLINFEVHKKVQISVPSTQTTMCCSNYYYTTRPISLLHSKSDFIVDSVSQPHDDHIPTEDPATKLYHLLFTPSTDACWKWEGVAEIQITPQADVPMLLIDATIEKKVGDFLFNQNNLTIRADLLGSVLSEAIETETEYLVLSSQDKYLKKTQRNKKIRARISITNMYLKWLFEEVLIFATQWKIAELNSKRKSPLSWEPFLPPKGINWVETSIGYAAEVELESTRSTRTSEC